MIDLVDGNIISGFGKINVLLGKNGSGKSTLLRQLAEKLSDGDTCVRYITPERGGELRYSGDIETMREQDSHWFDRSRQQNQWNQFKQSSVSEFRNLEVLALRIIEAIPEIRKSDFVFDHEIAQINSILDRVEIRRSEAAGFDIFQKTDNQSIAAQTLRVRLRMYSMGDSS